ncbi:cell division protein CrgA [Nocardioides sp. CPCC 205120]|uniref:cell division protein CrgA n=1 Tax=Nocardioides sp. CPCC 205120 TaxID=3406462 RepID=UPI003B5065C4
MSKSEPEKKAGRSGDPAKAAAGATRATKRRSGGDGDEAVTRLGRLGRGARPRDDLAGLDVRQERLITPRFVLMVALVLAGIAYIVLTWRSLGANPPADWSGYRVLQEDGTSTTEGPRKWVWELGLWNYAIGFGAILVGLIIGAHRSTPLGRGNGVVVGMLACFGIGLLWICTFYLFADNITDVWVLGALGQWNLVVGIAFMAVGFSYATKWE